MDPRRAMRVSALGETVWMHELFSRADDASRDALGMAETRIGGGVVTVMARDPTGGFWNRTVGLGVDEPLTEDVLDEVLAFVRSRGGPLTILQVAPGADPAGWEDLLVRAGARPGADWVKFADLDVVPPQVATDLPVEVLNGEHGADFARVMCLGFGMPVDSPLPGWFATMPGWGGAHAAYGAFDGDELVAAAALVVDGDVASLCGAATLSEHRGRGAQGALMARRIEEAAARGCRWLATGTGAETPEPPNPSLHNMRRLGLTELYERRSWVWQAPTP